MHGETVEQAARVQRAGAEVARFGEDFPEHRRGNQRQATDHQHRRVPADEVDQYPGDQASAHPANRVATDVQTHGKADVLWVDLFAQVGHGDSRQTAQRQSDQRTHQQHTVPARHHRTGHGAQRSGEQSCHHHRFTSDTVGNRASDQQADGKHAGGDRQDQAALRRVDGILVGQQRHHRLHAVEQGESRKTAAEQRQHRAHEGRGAFFDVDLRQLSGDSVRH
ncbi:hypothetical protein D3C75_847640 [compost metagenome]